MSKPAPPFTPGVPPRRLWAPKQKFSVEDLPHGAYEAVLLADGQEWMRGNRSRVVYIANVLADKQRNAEGPLGLVVLSATVDPKAHLQLQWESPSGGELRFLVCFGGVRLCSLSLEGVPLGKSPHESLRFQPGARLEVDLENPQWVPAHPLAVLVIEPAQAWPRVARDRDAAWVEKRVAWG